MPKRMLSLLGLLAAAQLCAGNKVYVATFGNDRNPWDTFSQPCRTWLGAISKAGPSGVVLALDSGDFGSINVTQPIIIIPRNISVVYNPPSGNQDQDFGIYAALSGGSLVLDHVSVSIGADIFQTTSAQGIQVVAAAGVPVDLKDVKISGFFRGIDIGNAIINPTAPANKVLQNVSVSASEAGLNVNEAAVGAGRPRNRLALRGKQSLWRNRGWSFRSRTEDAA
jgi:hypothetical protein